MIKKIRTDQLKLGVYVTDFNCDNSQEHTRITKALIQTEKSIQIIRSWGIDEVYIDTSKGLDVEPGKSAHEIRQETEKILYKLALEKEPIAPVIPLKQEIKAAKEIRQEAVSLMKKTTNALLEEKEIDLDSVRQLMGKMAQSVTRNRDALLLLTKIRKKDEYTLMHSISVGSLVLGFCNYSGITYDMTINMAMGALLHDIGKTKIPIHILNKPGKLDPKELAIVQQHAEHSAEVLANTKDLPFEAFDIALHHHERQDGLGYPTGLGSKDIGLGSRISSICDVFDAITSARCYKPAIDKVSGLRKIYEWSGTHFDKGLAHKFISFIGVYPIGTCVKLENDQIGVVTGSSENILQPVVRLFYDDNKKKQLHVQEIDLSRSDINIANYESPSKWDDEKIQIIKSLSGELNPLR